MLYPRNNNFRSCLDISGIWKFKADRDKIGEKEGWFNGFDSDLDIAVPGSWNEMLEEDGLLDYSGNGWFATQVLIPKNYAGSSVWIRIGSADYNSKVWIGGKFVGENFFGYLPFELDITDFVVPGNKCSVVILVNNELSNESIPQGITEVEYEEQGRLREETYPPARFDFSPNGGIHRPVFIHTKPVSFINEIKVDTKILNYQTGKVFLNVSTSNADGLKCKFNIEGNSASIQDSADINSDEGEIELRVENCRFWSPEDPFLYEGKVQLLNNDEIIDEYSIKIGIREIKLDGMKLLLNGKEIYLKGFGKHEDFWVIGKGLFTPLLVKDFGIMKWINANSFRTSHYPYADEIMNYADEKGILVIDEVPAVSLDLRTANDKTLQNHKDFITKLIDRDYNHPSVIMWAVGNEPNLVGAESYYDGRAYNYWKEVFEHTKNMDSSRPVTVPNCQRAGINDPVFEFSDIITINRYYGWYEHPGKLDKALVYLENEMDMIFEKYDKPIMITEFGADTVSGIHSIADQMFSEEYQIKLIEKYIGLFRKKEYVVGEHIWNFADFRTPMHFRRVMLNLKGVFTRERQPKSVAFRLKDIWKD